MTTSPTTPEPSEAEAAKTKTTEAEMQRQIARFGFDGPSGQMDVGAIVDCIIGSEFTPFGSGKPIRVQNRSGGKVLGINEYGQWEVCWPNGETYSYQRSILTVVS